MPRGPEVVNRSLKAVCTDFTHFYIIREAGGSGQHLAQSFPLSFTDRDKIMTQNNHMIDANIWWILSRDIHSSDHP